MKPTSIAYAAIGLICFVAGFLICGVVFICTPEKE